jgi:hypothetical protein
MLVVLLMMLIRHTPTLPLPPCLSRMPSAPLPPFPLPCRLLLGTIFRLLYLRRGSSFHLAKEAVAFLDMAMKLIIPR